MLKLCHNTTALLHRYISKYAPPYATLALSYIVEPALNSRWIIDRVFCDHDSPDSPMICCIGHRMNHTKAMIQRGLRYRVMRANVVNWNRRAIPGSIYNPESLRGYTFDHA